MKNLFYLVINLSILLNSCAQQKFEKPPKLGTGKYDKLKNALPNKKASAVISLGELKKNIDSLYCWKKDNECNVLDGQTTIFSYYQTSGDDNPKLIPYTYAKGEFLEGKYHGKWFFYDKNKKIVKIENWRNGSLITTKK